MSRSLLIILCAGLGLGLSPAAVLGQQIEGRPAIQPEKVPDIRPLPRPTENPVSTQSGSAPTVLTSFVGEGSDAASDWITGLIANGSSSDGQFSVKHQVVLLNPDTSRRADVNITCYDQEGERVAGPEKVEVAPLAAMRHVFAHTFGAEEGAIGEGWCRLQASHRILASGESIEINRQGSRPGVTSTHMAYFAAAR